MKLQKLFPNPSNGSRDTDWNINLVIISLTLNYYLDLEVTLVKHAFCTSSHHTWHVCWVICKSHKGFKRYRVDTTVCLTFKYHLDLEVTFVKHALCTSSYQIWNVCQVVLKCHQHFKSYRADNKYSHTMFNLEVWP